MEESANGSGGVSENGCKEAEMEQRPGEMLSQKTADNANGDDGVGASGPMIKINVSHGSNQHYVAVPAYSTFGDLKMLLARETGLEAQGQRLLFRGKEKADEEYLHIVGVKDMSKVVLLEDIANKDRKVEETKQDPVSSKTLDSLSQVRAEVDKLSQKAAALEAVVHGGTKVAEKEFLVLSELFMVQLLKLDSIEAEGEAKLQRRNEVRRVQNCVENLDNLKAINSNPFISSSNAVPVPVPVPVTTQWEAFDSGVGGMSSPPTVPSPCKITHDWVQFD